MKVQLSDGRVFVFKFSHIREEVNPAIKIKCGNKKRYLTERRSTICRVFDGDNRVVFHVVKVDGKNVSVPIFGAAHCNPVDNYSKSTGRKLALKIALDLLYLTKGEKETVWQEYFRMHKS